MKKLIVILALSALPCIAQSDRQWLLDSSTLTYHVSHPLHQVDGVSHKALGKGACHAGECDFLIAVEVKTFDSGDSNRDLHMLQVTKGAEFPFVSVRLHLPESALSSAAIVCDLDIQFSGQTAHFQYLTFQHTIEGNEHHISGTIPATLSDFKITPPSFFAVPLRNEMPVKVDMTWHPQ
ncbi:MAG: hypothetical protein ABSF70_14500 [Terracidiphilus sp.]|jgi:hypothetical protein